MDEQRNAKGQFQKGWSGGPGRPKTDARAAVYLAVAQEVCTLEDWRGVVLKAKIDALTGEDGATRERGRRFLADYLIGRPKQVVAIEHDSDSVYEQYAELSDDELAALIVETERADAATGAGHSELPQSRAAGGIESGAAAAER